MFPSTLYPINKHTFPLKDQNTLGTSAKCISDKDCNGKKCYTNPFVPYVLLQMLGCSSIIFSSQRKLGRILLSLSISMKQIHKGFDTDLNACCCTYGMVLHIWSGVVHMEWFVSVQSDKQNYMIACISRPAFKLSASLLHIMGKSKEISQELRKKIVSIQKSGSSLGAISKHLKVPRSSVQTIVRKYKHHGTTQPSYRSRRRCVLSPRD